MGSNLRFALIKALHESAKEGEISWITSLRARFVLRLASDAKLEQIQQAIGEQAMMDGVIQDGADLDGIDWTQFLEFLKKILPIILPILIALI